MIKKKIYIVNFFFFFIFYIIADVLFSTLYFKESVDYKCYNYSDDGLFYKLKENCFAKMRLLSEITSFDVYTDKNGYRYSGTKKLSETQTSVLFLGDSFTFGVGVDWENTFTGILEKEIEKKYNIYNLGVPSYSPTTYKYSLINFLKNNSDKKIEKIFILLDITDINDESRRWIEIKDKPYLKGDKVFINDTFFQNIKRKYFKGTFFIANFFNDTSRKFKKKFQNEKKIYRPVEGTMGDYIYKDYRKSENCRELDEKNIFWNCGDLEAGIIKTQKQFRDISKILSKKNIQLYIIILPWPDTLNFGQKYFNFENFSFNLCKLSNCKKVINMYPDFIYIKKNNKEWLNKIFLPNDIHLNAFGHEILAQKILREVFKNKN